MIFHFFNGMAAMGFAIAALFFLRFWQQTRDGLFLAFCVAFVFFTLNQALITLSDVPREEQSWIYLLRLAGFVVLLIGIARKNLARDPPAV
jgi:hypothetical protein